jgi:hypothetical protein
MLSSKGAYEMYVQLAPIRLKGGIDEKKLMEASDVFERDFVSKQQGITKRLLLRGKDGSYADLVFFESKSAADRVAEIEATSPACHTFMSIMEAPDESLPDMGILSFEHIKTYE